VNARYRTPVDALTPGEWIAAGVVGALTIAAIPVWLTTVFAALLHTGRWWSPPAGDVAHALAGWHTHLADPAAAFPASERTRLPAAPAFYLCAAVALLLLGGLVIVVARILARPRRMRGAATAADVRSHLSATAVRRRGRHARPALTGRVAPEQVGLYLGRDMRSGQQMWGSVEDSYLYLGPPRSGKGVHLIIPQTLAAPGAVLVTSTRNDVVRHTARLREQRGPVVVFDPQEQVSRRALPRLRWAPHRGCGDPLVAIGRARALAAASKFAVGTTTNGDYWQAMTEAVLRCYLHAAALSGRPASELMVWTSQPTDPTPVRILRAESAAAPGWAEELASQAAADPRQRDSVWSGVRRAFDCLADPRVLDACSPTDDDGFDPTVFLTGNGTLYLLGDTDSQLSVAPLISALLEDLLGVARRGAAHSAGGRLDPPLLLLLDEAANIAPIPSLHNLLADGGGTGITTVAVLQSLAQARHRWGQPAAEALWDAATTKVVLGGLAQADDLQRISRLAGDIDEPTVTRTTGPGGGSMSVAERRLPALPVEMLRTLPQGQAVVLARHTAPVLTRLRPWTDLPQAATIRGDAAALA
jgi:type IV secretion system protein VirD4